MSLKKSLAALGAAGLLMAAGPAFAAKDQLTIGVAQFPSTLHPNIDAEVIKSYTLGFVIRQITAFDKNWKNGCLLCTELPSVQNGLAKIIDLPDGKKGMQVTIKLKPDLKWGDGEKVTAKDLEFTWRIARDPKTGFSNTHPWSRAIKVDVVDDSTAVLTLDKVIASYNEWDQVLPAHIEGPVYEKAKEAGDYVKQTTYARSPTTAGLYNGPYLVSGYQSGSQIVLEPNPHWPGTKPGFKRIVIKLIENTAALQANLLSGDVDMVAGEGVGLTIDQVLELRKQHPDRFTYLFKPSLNYEHIDLQIGNPILKDVRVRQALIYAADRKTLTERLFQGMQPVADTWVNPLSTNFTKDTIHYPYDPAKAKALLAEAGWMPKRQGRAPVGRVRHHRRQPPARAAAIGAAEQLEGLLHRGSHQERAGPDVLRRDPEEARLWRPRDVRLVERGDGIAAPHPRQRQHPDRSERLGRRQLHRLLQQAHGRADRQIRSRPRSGGAEEALARHAADLRQRGAGHSAVFPRRSPCLSEVAERLRAHRPWRLGLVRVGELAQRVIAPGA